MNEAPERIWADWSPADEDTMPATIGCYTPKCRDVARWKRVDYVRADRIEALTAERDEALNQLDSATHSVEVLEKRVAKFMADNARLTAALTDARPYLERGLDKVAFNIIRAALKGETP